MRPSHPYISEAEELPVLVGAAEAQELLGVGETRLRQLRRDPDFPPPAVELRGGAAWYLTDLEAWAEANAERRQKHSRKTA